MKKMQRVAAKNKKNILLFMTVIIIFSALSRPLTACAASYKSWVDNASNSSLYGNSSFNTGEEDPDSAKVEEEAGWLEEHISKAIISFAYVLWELEREAGMTIDDVILGRLSRNVSVNNFGFDLSDGNIYGVISSIVYAILRNFMFGLFGIYYMYLLIKFLLNGTGKGRASLKDALYNFIFTFSLLYAIPIITDFVIFCRDALLKMFMDKALSFQSGASSLNLPGLFITEAESNYKVTYAILAVFATAGALWLGFNYIKIAIQEAYLFGIFPAVAFRSFSDKQIVNKWTGQFVVNLCAPLLDAIGFTMLSYMVSQPNALASFGQKMIALLLFFSIIPCRNMILQLFGAPVPGRGFSLAPLAMMASRLARGGGGHGSSSKSISDGTDDRNRPAGSGGTNDTRITDPNRQNGNSSIESGNNSITSGGGNSGYSFSSVQNSDVAVSGNGSVEQDLAADVTTAAAADAVTGEETISGGNSGNGGGPADVDSETISSESSESDGEYTAGRSETISGENHGDYSENSEGSTDSDSETISSESSESGNSGNGSGSKNSEGETISEKGQEKPGGQSTENSAASTRDAETVRDDNKKQLDEARKTSDAVQNRFGSSNSISSSEFGTDNSAELIKQSQQLSSKAEQAGIQQQEYGMKADTAASKAQAEHDKAIKSAEYSQKRADFLNSSGLQHVTKAMDTSGRIVAAGAGMAAAAAAVSATAISGDANTIVGAGMAAKMGTQKAVSSLTTNADATRAGLANAFQQEADLKKNVASKSPSVKGNLKKAAKNTQQMRAAGSARNNYVKQSANAATAAAAADTKVDKHPEVKYQTPKDNKEAANQLNQSMEKYKNGKSD